MVFLRLLAVALALAGLKGVGIILVDPDGRFLLNLRGDRRSKQNMALPDRWAILGGGIEPGEASEQAALREILEEVGRPVPRVHRVVHVSWPRPVHLYAAGLPPPLQALAGEGVEHRWLTLDEVSRLSPRAPLLRPVLRAFAGTAAYRASIRDARQT